MLDLLIFCLCVSFACVAIHISFVWEGMIFSKIGSWIMENVPDVYAKPFIECLSCMGSFWTVVFWFATGRELSWWLVFAILITVGINTLICALLEKVSDYGC